MAGLEPAIQLFMRKDKLDGRVTCSLLLE